MKKQVTQHPLAESAVYLLRWTLFAIAAGALGGLAGGLFSKVIRLAGQWHQSVPWLLYLLPLIGVVIAFAYHVTGEDHNRGTNMVLSSVLDGEPVTIPTGPLIFLSTGLSHLGGASVGREGAALQMGGWLGSGLGHLLRFNEKDKKTAVMCGMSALFAALFGTPVAAAIFCIEVASVGNLFYSALIPCVFSAFIGTGVASALGSAPEVFEIMLVPEITPKSLSLSVLLGLLCALVAILLVQVFHKTEAAGKRYLKNPYLRALVIGALIVFLTEVLQTRDFTGAGSQLIERALRGDTKAHHFALKMLFTALALAAGFKGGEIVPTLSIGACFGALFGSLTGFPISMGAACGMIAVFAGATNCPIAALMIAMEMFGGKGLPYFAVTTAMAFILSGYYSLYGSQRFAFSKTSHEQKDPKEGARSAETEHQTV